MYCEHHLALLGLKQLTRLRDEQLSQAERDEDEVALNNAITLDDELRRRAKRHGRGSFGYADSIELTPESIAAGIRLRQELRQLMQRYCRFEIGVFTFDPEGVAEDIEDVQTGIMSTRSGLVARGAPTVGGPKSRYSCGGSNIYGELEPEQSWIDIVTDAFDREIRMALIIRQQRGTSGNLWPKFLYQ